MRRKQTVTLKKLTDFINSRLKNKKAQKELKKIGDCRFDWRKRTQEACNIFVPEIFRHAPSIILQVEEKFNSPRKVLHLLEEELPPKITAEQSNSLWLKNILPAARRSVQLIGNLESQQVSAEIQRIVSSNLSNLTYPNGKSIYPDFVLTENNYHFLKFQNKKDPIEGPCLKGKTKNKIKPSNVPDGMELKCNRGSRIKVDAHGAHLGLHMGVTWSLDQTGHFKVGGIFLTYIREFDHSISLGNLKVTTKKASFGHQHFLQII